MISLRMTEEDKNRVRHRANSMGLTVTRYMLLCERKFGGSLVRQFAVDGDGGSYQVEEK